MNHVPKLYTTWMHDNHNMCICDACQCHEFKYYIHMADSAFISMHKDLSDVYSY